MYDQHIVDTIRSKPQKCFDAMSDLHTAVMIAGSGGKGKTSIALALQAGSQMPYDPNLTITVRGQEEKGGYLTSSNINLLQGEDHERLTSLRTSAERNKGLAIYSPYGVNYLSALTSDQDHNKLSTNSLANYRINPLSSPIRRIMGEVDSPFSDIYGSIGKAASERLTTHRLLLDNSNAITAFAKLFLTSESLIRMTKASVISKERFDRIMDMRSKLIEEISNDMLRAISRYMSESDDVGNAEKRFLWAVLSALTSDNKFTLDSKFDSEIKREASIAKDKSRIDSLERNMESAFAELDKVERLIEDIRAGKDENDADRQSRKLNDLSLRQRVLAATVKSYKSERERLDDSFVQLEKSNKGRSFLSKFDSTSKHEFAQVISELMSNHPDSILDASISQGIISDVIDCNLDGLVVVGAMIDDICEQFRETEGAISTIRTEESDRLTGFDARLIGTTEESYVITTTRNDFSMRTSLKGSEIAQAFMLFSTVRVGALNSAMAQGIKYGTTLKGGLPESILISAQALSDAAFSMKSRIFIETRDDFNVDLNGESKIRNSPDSLDVASERLGSSTRIALIIKEIGVFDFRMKGFGEYQDVPFTEITFKRETDMYVYQAWIAVKGLDVLSAPPELFEHQPVTGNSKVIGYDSHHIFNRDIVL